MGIGAGAGNQNFPQLLRDKRKKKTSSLVAQHACRSPPSHAMYSHELWNSTRRLTFTDRAVVSDQNEVDDVRIRSSSIDYLCLWNSRQGRQLRKVSRTSGTKQSGHPKESAPRERTGVGRYASVVQVCTPTPNLRTRNSSKDIYINNEWRSTGSFPKKAARGENSGIAQVQGDKAGRKGGS